MNWFTPKCPVAPDEKQWLESAMLWLIEEFGPEFLRDVRVVLPTPEFFPDPFSSRREDVKRLVHRVCGYMGVDPDRLELQFYSEREPDDLRHRLPFYEGSHSGSAGHFRRGKRGKFIIGIEASQLDEPMSLVATVAHELGHILLLGDRRLSPADGAQEELTDLLTVFFGLGIFTANSAFKFSQFTSASTQGWQASRLGYLPESAFGYALALFAWARGESAPAWSKHLEFNVRPYFKQSLKYLAKTSDSPLAFDLVSQSADEEHPA